MDSFKPEISLPFTGNVDCYWKKRRIDFKEVPTDESLDATEKDSKTDTGNGNLLSQSASGSSESYNQSSESGGLPAEVRVAGGEVSVEEESNALSCLSHGSISMIGRRRMMEDAVKVDKGIVAGEFAFFAVYDGHGGSRIANACRNRLHQLLANEIEKRKLSENTTGGGSIDWEKVMVACFAKMDEEVNGSDDGSGFEMQGGSSVPVRSIGSTAVVVLVGKEELVVANCGDSRAVLCHDGIAVPLSRDHQPGGPDERKRVEAAGGKVTNWNGCRVLGVLATSRSIGHEYLKPSVISVPEVTVRKRTESTDDFLIVATDGLWDAMSNDLACHVVRKCLADPIRSNSGGNCATEAAAMLTELAMGKGSKDNISIIVVELNDGSFRSNTLSEC